MPALVLAFVLACLPGQQARAQELAAVPALDSPVVDTTGTLDAAQRTQLERQALDLQHRKGSQMQVLVVASTQPESIEQYTQRVFDQWRPGRKGVDDAVLVVVAKDDRRVRIQPGYGLEGAIPDITAGRIIQEYMAPKFRAGDYGGGIIDATAVLVRLIDGEPLPELIAGHRGDGDRSGGGGSNWLGALFAAFVVATIVRGVFGRAPALLRGLFTGGAAGAAAWLLSAALGLGGIAAVIGFLFGLSNASGGRYVRHGGWGGFGGGGWGGGGFGGGGGGWSGGGGMSGGGGASGSW